MRTYLISYLSCALAFICLDGTWLSLTMKPVYKAHLGPLLLDKPNFLAAAIFYIFYAAGIAFFAVMPSLAKDQWLQPFALGALLGVLAYGTYDLSNLATLKDWSSLVTIVDMVWGGVATGLAATIGYFAVRRFS